MPYFLYGGPHDGQTVDCDELTLGHYTVLLSPPAGGVGMVEYHLRTIRVRVATGGTLMIDVLAHSPCNEADLSSRVLDDFAAEIEHAKIKPYEYRHTRGEMAEPAESHLRLIDLSAHRPAFSNALGG